MGLSSVDWVCEYRNCEVIFKRYQRQIKEGIKRFCSQSHASLEQFEQEGSRNRKIPTYNCKWCNTETTNWTKSCNSCKRVETRVIEIRKESQKLEEFTPLDYYDLLEKQNSKCGICKKECVVNKNFTIDHDHKTGKVRGLLCNRCNYYLGWFENKQQGIKEYLDLV